MIPVLMTTDSSKRGVFFGYINAADADKDTLVAHDVQMCISWSADMKGVLGLASMGPSSSCRVGEPVPKATIKGITLVVETSKAAEKAWKKMPWSK